MYTAAGAWQALLTLGRLDVQKQLQACKGDHRTDQSDQSLIPVALYSHVL